VPGNLSRSGQTAGRLAVMIFVEGSQELELPGEIRVCQISVMKKK
jgi:hypothetical protein